MSVQPSFLGQCPGCGANIPAAYLLIEYETSRGTARFAECPDCGEVVHPDRDGGS